MATLTPSLNSRGPTLDPGICRCCRSIKRCRILTSEYQWMDKREVYSDMIMDCFGLLLTHLDGDQVDVCICATCVTRLREATAFRSQVLLSEELFLNSKLEASEVDTDQKVVIKSEPCIEHDFDAMDDRDTVMEETPRERKDKSFFYIRIGKFVLPPIKEIRYLKKQNERRASRNLDFDIKPEVDTKLSPYLSEDEKPLRKITRSCKKKEVDNALKQNLVGKMNSLKSKLNTMLKKPEQQRQKRKSKKNLMEIIVKPKKDRKELDTTQMIYKNVVTIVENSFVCPFRNRISFYYCYYCKDQFTNPNELREHTQSHDPKKEFEDVMEYKKIPKIDITRIDCRLCQESISDVEVLKTHLKDVHDKHMYDVKDEFLKFKLTMDSIKCTECDSSFPFFDALKKHMIDHFGSYTCDMCGACFLEQTSLRTHIKSHSKVETNFPCEICGKNLKSKYSKHLHIATVHEKKPTVNCYKCEACFLSYALRNRHLIEVHGDKRTFPCKLCDKVYNRRKTLMEHNRRNHLKVLNHQCDLCDQRFYLPSRLKEHMATHTGERNFRCEFCDKSYPRLQSLQEHVRSHNNDRRFKCDICNSTFTQNSSLKSHLKSHHGYGIDGSYA